MCVGLTEETKYLLARATLTMKVYEIGPLAVNNLPPPLPAHSVQCPVGTTGLQDCAVMLNSFDPLYINLLKTKLNLLYIRNQSVLRSKHFPARL